MGATGSLESAALGLGQLEFTASGPPAPDVLQCEVDVLGRWYGDTRELLADAYGPYESHTSFLSVRDAAGTVQGWCRLIRPGGPGLKTISDVGDPPWEVDGARAARAAEIDLDRTWDVATLGVRRELGGAGAVVAAAIYHGIIASCRVNDVPWVIGIVDRRVRQILATLGLTLRALPGTGAKPYMGSPACAPIYAHVAQVLDEQRRTSPDAHRLIALAAGLDGIQTPLPEDYLMPA